MKYSASGTQWKSYASGYYTSTESPLGPYTYASTNPMTRNTEGIVTGPAHGSVIEGPDGNLWQFYTVVLSIPPGGRRIGMDRVILDNDGNMSVKITDTPQWAPGTIDNPTLGSSGSIPLTISKMNVMNTESKVSSAQPGRDAAYAMDNNSGTWWTPDTNDTKPTLIIDLSSATTSDVVQLYNIDSYRMLFNRQRRSKEPVVYQYKIEASVDGQTYSTVIDQTKNTISRSTIFEEIPPTNCRLIRLTITNWPKTQPIELIEFTIFGKSEGYLPAKVPIPRPR